MCTENNPKVTSFRVGGDVNWFTYGADFLRLVIDANPDDDTDYYYLVHIEGIEGSYPGQEIEEDDLTTVEVYQSSLPDSKAELFECLDWVDWNSVYKFADINPQEIGDEPIDYVQLAISAFDYHGWLNADEYPGWMTQSEIKKYLNLDD